MIDLFNWAQLDIWAVWGK